MSVDTKKLPRGIRNNNPLNIRKGNSWKGERGTQRDSQFEEFISMTYGIRAALILIRNHVTGFKGTRPRMNTVRKLISVWAPKTENATEEYILYVCRQLNVQPSHVIDPTDRKFMCELAREMAYVECGRYLSRELFESAYDLIC